MKGTVKWFSEDKGYGFITDDDGQDYYFGIRSISGTDLPANKDIVEFIPQKASRGLRANNINILEKKKTHTTRSPDQRIECPSCERKIIPRLVTYRGEPDKSLCPFCGATVKNFGWCFIATAVYEDAFSPEVMALRKFRDQVLMPTTAGRLFVAFYYFVSPPLARWLKKHERARRPIRWLLDRIVTRVTVG